MSVIQFSEYKPHLSGEIKCIACGHKWVGICPINPDGDVPCMECPECGLMQGFYIYPVLPETGDEVFKCNCGGEVFFITRQGPRCIRCGVKHDLDKEGKL